MHLVTSRDEKLPSTNSWAGVGAMMSTHGSTCSARDYCVSKRCIVLISAADRPVQIVVQQALEKKVA